MANAYPEGQCTWGAVEMCPCLGDLGRYGDFGNGGDWYAHAQQVGLPTSTTPQVGWLASFDVLPPFGDVGLIVAVNNDGTVTRYGVNWHLDGTWSVDKVPTRVFKGCFMPPCTCTGPSGMPISAELLSAHTNCRTFSWNLLGGQICFDGVLAAFAMAGGAAMMVAGAIIMVVWAARTHGGQAVIRSAEVTGSTAQAATAPIRRAPTGKRTTAEQAASRQRVAASRVRAATRRTAPVAPRSGRKARPAAAPAMSHREAAHKALQENRPLTPEQMRAIGATEVPKQ